MSLSRVTVTLLALLVTALHVRFVTNVGGLWRDEANSVNLATLPSFAEMWRVLDFDSFPILFFAVLRGWTAIFGANDDLALRVLGLITGLGILGAAWASGRSFSIKWPVLSLALIGLNPMLIRYGDSTRAYGLGILLILLTLRSFWRLVDSPGPPTTRRIIEATLLAVLSVQCLYYNSVLLLAIAAGAMAVAIQSRAWRTLCSILGIGMLAAASLLPYIPMMRRMREWTFLVSYPDGGFAWLWTRLCEVLGSPSRLGIWLWPGLGDRWPRYCGRRLGNGQAEAGNVPWRDSNGGAFCRCYARSGRCQLRGISSGVELLDATLVLHHSSRVRRLPAGGPLRSVAGYQQIENCVAFRPPRGCAPPALRGSPPGLEGITDTSHRC